jgi:phosphotransferase system enzyme I (PtsI)
MTFALHGIGASKGIAIGKVHRIERGQPEIHEYSLPKSRIRAEVRRFQRALADARADLRSVLARIPKETASDVSGFIDAHLLMLEDSTLTTVPIEIIRERRCNAEWALKMQRDAVISVFDAMDDEYLRTRKDDVDNVVNRIFRRLLAQDEPQREGARQLLAGKVVFADELTPSDTVLMQHQGVLGVVTEYGGPNSHTAILARSLRIPAVVGVHAARQYLRDDELVILDGRQGVVIGAPAPSILEQYRRGQRAIERFATARQKLRRARVVTSDGERIGLQANVELPEDVETASRLGAEGIGLYRTEFLFMNRAAPPDEEEQYEAYCGVVSALTGSPVTIRTLDLGADKQVDGARPGAPATANPALGLRAVRLCLKEPELFIPQLRAILRASAHGPIRLMIPMLSSIQELFQVLRIVKQCGSELAKEGKPYDPAMPIGAMIEVPAAALCADLFARHVDFLSIGTNDLIQYTIAIDRIDDEVNYLYDPLHPAVLRLVHGTIKAGQRARIPVAMCGEMAGDARYTRLLLGMGLREFSVHPNAILEVKQAINGSHIGAIRKLAQRMMRTVRPSKRDQLLDEMNRPDGIVTW